MDAGPDPVSSSPLPEPSAVAPSPSPPDITETMTRLAADIPAIRHTPSILRFLFIAVAGLLVDLWSKHRAFDALRQGETHVIVPHVLEFQTLLNPGALFGIGGGQTSLFLVASVAALGLVGWMFSQTPSSRWLLQLALGAILAGALGNMYDRVTVKLVDQRFATSRGFAVYLQRMEQVESGYRLEEYPPGQGGIRRTVSELPSESGYVRDFIKIPTRWMGGREIWPWVFNVADMLLVGGVIVLAVHLWRDRKVDAPPPSIEAGTNLSPTA